MKKVYITFGGAIYDPTTEIIVRDGVKYGADEVWVYDDKWFMETDFFKLKGNQWLLDHHHKRGFYWYVWKAFIIYDALQRLQDGDIVLYTDADCFPISDFSMLYDQCNKDGGIMLFAAQGWHNFQWCKKDCYIVMNQDDDKYKNCQAGVARFMLFQKGKWKATQFLMEWLTYCVNEKATTFDPSVLSKEEEGFREHRTEQAIMTLLAHKYGLKLYREACEAGQGYEYDRDLYPQLFSQVNPYLEKKTADIGDGSKYRNV